MALRIRGVVGCRIDGGGPERQTDRAMMIIAENNTRFEKESYVQGEDCENKATREER